jgi:hypothetical protein
MEGETTLSAVVQEMPMTAREIRANVNLIQEVMKGVMKDKTHYGIIPGCPKPSLWKPGAEKLLSTFRIGVSTAVDDISTSDEIRYRVKCRATSPTGIFLGEGLGEASSSEEKYKWRKPVCDAEFNETPEDRRREKWSKGDSGPYKQKQIRTQPADVANTILKMAHKRGIVSVTLLATAASDIFTQDIEDMDDVQSGEALKPAVKAPERKAAPAAAPSTSPAPNGNGGTTSAPPPPTGNAISEPQRKRFYAIYKHAGLADDAVKAYLKQKYGIEHTADITRDFYEEVCAWAERGGVDEPPDEPGANG